MVKVKQLLRLFFFLFMFSYFLLKKKETKNPQTTKNNQRQKVVNIVKSCLARLQTLSSKFQFSHMNSIPVTSAASILSGLGLFLFLKVQAGTQMLINPTSCFREERLQVPSPSLASWCSQELSLWAAAGVTFPPWHLPTYSAMTLCKYAKSWKSIVYSSKYY